MIVNTVREKRLAANMSVKLLAKVMAVPEQYIYDLEANNPKILPNIEFCYNLASVLEVSITDLFTDSKANKRYSVPTFTPCSVYILEDSANGVIKIGISKQVKRRQTALEAASGRKLTLVHTSQYPDRLKARAEESRLHNLLSDYRLPGEWFNLTYADLIRNHLH